MKLTAAGQTVVSKKIIGQYYRFYIDDVVNNDIIDYQYSYSLEFGSASLEVELENSDGRYSPGGASEVAIGAVGELKEGILVSGAYEVFSKFKGVLRQRQYSKSAGENTARFMFLDYIVKLQEMDIGTTHADQIFESSKTAVTNEELTYNALTDTGWENQSQVYDFANPAGSVIAPTPEPIIKILRTDAGSDTLGQPAFDGYEINYETGQLTLNIPINFTNYKVVANYYYYPTGTYVEDWIEDVIIETDVFGNTPFSAATNLRTTYQAEEGTGATDTMTLNTSTVTYGGSDYTAGKVAYTDYDNVQTDLVAGDFTINGGAIPGGQFVAFDKRFGRLFLTTSHTGDEIICTNNYSFSTLQATAIYIPYIDLTTRSVANRFDAIKKLKDNCAPNYIISTKGGNKIWGRYLSDKTTADYTLYLEKSLNYAEDIKDIYTRVKLYGQSNSPTNLMIQKSTTFTKGFTYMVSANEAQLVPEGDWQGGAWQIFGVATASSMMTIDTRDTSKIKVWVDDVLLGGANAPTERTFSKVNMETGCARDDGQSEYKIWFPDTDLVWDTNHPINFYDSNGTNTYVLNRTGQPNNNGEYLYAGTNIPVRLDTRRGSWQIPEDMNDNLRILFIGQSQSTFAIQALMRTVGHDYSLHFDYYNGQNNGGVSKAEWSHNNNGWRSLGLYNFTYKSGYTKVIGVHDLLTQRLINWGERAPVGGVGIDGGDWSYYYGELNHWYAHWGPLYDWVPHTINGEYMYWIAIWTTRLPTSIGFISRIGSVIGDWNDPAAFSSATKVFAYRNDTKAFTDYTTDCANGNANLPFLEVGSFQASTSHAKYFVFHPPTLWQIPTIAPYNSRKFAIATEVFPMDEIDSVTKTVKADLNKHIVKASFDYLTTTPDTTQFSLLKDGDPNTQWQLEMVSAITSGQILFTVSFNDSAGNPELKDIDAIDITTGFFNPANPDDTGYTGSSAIRYDIKNWYSIQYSTDGITYSYINKETYNFPMSGGESKSFEAEVLGEGFQAKYIRLIIENASMVDYQNGRWVASIVDFSVWQNIIIKADAKLGATAVLPTTTNPESIVADSNSLRTKIGEKVFKINEINKNAMTNYTTGMRAYNLLSEYVKNATRVNVDVAYSPHLELGQTVQVIDSVNGTNRNYFIEGMSNSKGNIGLQLAYYP